MRRERNLPGLPQKAEGRAVEDICDPFAAAVKPNLKIHRHLLSTKASRTTEGFGTET
jgi:hypothetical protein